MHQATYSSLEKNLIIQDKARLCQCYLNQLYRDIPPSPTLASSSTSINETYGEILPGSIDKILAEVTLRPHDSFFDLGSGTGRVVAQIFLQTALKQACGIELNAHLHQQALDVCEKIQMDLPLFYGDARKLTYLLGSFLEISFKEATILFVNSVCFSQTLIRSLSKLINEAPSIHTIFSTRPLYNLAIPFKKSIRIECSWDSALCFIYARN